MDASVTSWCVDGLPRKMNHESGVLPRHLSYDFLYEITDGFSEKRKIGSGTYGRVYLGVSKDGEKIAVKVLYGMQSHGDNDKQFDKEFHNLTCLRHPNIVQFVGYCHETHRECIPYDGKLVLADVTKRALCFEYMHNGRLDNFLYDESSGHDWDKRYTIIKGICMGLKYLHEELEPPIFHLDLKPANVLLDEDMVPRIADFGLSRFLGEERTYMTGSSVGTFGYLPPEFINQHVISNKLDVFSIGVIIIKIMTGPTGYSRSAEMSSQEFIEHVHGNWRNRLLAASVDGLDSYCKQVKACIEIALRCVEGDRQKRPTIGDVVNELNETETIRKINDALRNDSGSSMEQVICQLHLTKVEDNPVKKKLRETENLLSEVVDDVKVDQTSEETERDTKIPVNENGNDMRAFVFRGQYITGTLCHLYNATGDTLYYVKNHNWYGEIDSGPYPKEISSCQWVAFHHAHSSFLLYSTAVVVYRGKNKHGKEKDLLLSWSCAASWMFRNKCYCEIGGVEYFQANWPNLKKKLVNSDYYSSAKADGYAIEAKIGKGTTPTMTVRISSS